ncbi:MAG: alpha-amylase family glycosyl hydrolase [Paraclostridium sp.]
MIIYELHVNMFGTNYMDIISHIPRLKAMGVTHVQLMPIHECNSYAGEKWGYSPINFMNLNPNYGTVERFRKLVDRLKENGIGTIVDVVYNHSGDTSKFPEQMFRKSNGYHTNYSGCGNTFDSGNPDFIDLVKDSLLNLVDMGVDGFRFDLGELLAYDKNMNFLAGESALEHIVNEPILNKRKLIVEPWSPFSYNKDKFPEIFYEHNDQYRDALRKYIRTDMNSRNELVDAIYSSFKRRNINYVTCHDGFTLFDLVSFNQKRNEINGEYNTDGCNNNLSYNHGYEGLTNDEAINNIRYNKMKIALAILYMTSNDLMLLAGDELCRTQYGNNNSYKKIECLDNNPYGINMEKTLSDLSHMRENVILDSLVILDSDFDIVSRESHYHFMNLRFNNKNGGFTYMVVNPSTSNVEFKLEDEYFVIPPFSVKFFIK